MNVLDLFSGIGGFALGLHRAGFEMGRSGFRTAAVERGYVIEPWEQDVPRVIPRGAPNRTNRLKALGNAVVPAVVEAICRAVLRADREMS